MKTFLSGIFPLVVILVLSFGVVKPLFVPGFFSMHDDTQPARVYEMANSILSGQFPVRWVGDLGYGFGYPLFNFYAPLPYYIGAIFHILGLDIILTTKLMFGIGAIFAGITMYILLKKHAGSFPAIIGSILYMYAPYHAVDLYIRGAVGEVYALVFFPVLLFGVLNIFSGGSSLNIAVGGIGFAGILLSHNVLGMITIYILLTALIVHFIFTLLTKKKLTTFYYLLLTFLLGIGMSAFFIFPAFLEKGFTRVNELTSEGSNFRNHFVYLDQFWSSPWGFAGSAPGRLDGMSFMIGKIHLILGSLSVVIMLHHSNKKIKHFNTGLFWVMLILFFVSVFLMLENSLFLWEFIPAFSFIQYPWRFLAFAIFSLSVMIPISLSVFRKNAQKMLGVVILIISIGFNSRYFIPGEYRNVRSEDYTAATALKYKISKISDEYLPANFSNPDSLQNVAFQTLAGNSDFRINKSTEYPTRKSFDLDIYNSIKLVANLTYFPGWKARIDGKLTDIIEQNGKISVLLPVGRHRLDLSFENTPVRFWANTISIFSLFLVVYIIVLKKNEKEIR